MSYAVDWVKNNFKRAVGIQAGLSIVNFMGNVFMALSDGVVTGDEFNHILASAGSAVEMVIAVLIYYAFKKKD